MPAFLTHIIAADEIKNKLNNPRAKRVIETYGNAYQSGALGGDYFSTYKYYSMWIGHTYKMFGYALHRLRTKRFFTEGAEYINANGSNVLKGFFYGYITHYCLDYLLHPLIIKTAPNMLSSHNVLEYAIDTVYAHSKGIDAVTYDRTALLEATLVPGDEIDDFFKAMFGKLYYGFKLGPHPYTTAYKYYAEFCKRMYMPDIKRMFLISLQNLVTMLDLKSVIYKPYSQVKDMFDYKPFITLIDKAVGKSLSLIDTVDGYFNGEHDISVIKSVFYNVNFSGKPLMPMEESKAYRRAYKKAKLKLF